MEDNPEIRDRLLRIYEYVDRNNLRRMRPLPALKDINSPYYSYVRYQNALDCDQVFPNIFLGNEGSARNIHYLKELGITHILNCAEGGSGDRVSTGISYYTASNIQYKGYRLSDSYQQDVRQYFYDGAKFIDDALNSENGKILIHCFAGVSRSATIVIAYLMLKCKFTVEEAIRQLCQHRLISPNQGFIKQLVLFDIELRN